MEVPRLGVKLELQLPAYTIATAMWDPSHICDLHCSLRQCQIFNLLSEARAFAWSDAGVGTDFSLRSCGALGVCPGGQVGHITWPGMSLLVSSEVPLVFDTAHHTAPGTKIGGGPKLTFLGARLPGARCREGGRN